MKRWQIAAVAGIAVLLFVLGGAVAFAQGPNPDGTDAFAGCGVWGGNWKVFDAAAEALGLTPVQLFTELHSGKTLAQVAEAKGVDLDKVTEAMSAARTENMRDAIQKAVEEGRLSQDQADWLLEGLSKGLLRQGRGLGRGWGMGLHI